MPGFAGETVTEGLDGLRERLKNIMILAHVSLSGAVLWPWRKISTILL